jgi:hypothetical protein
MKEDRIGRDFSSRDEWDQLDLVSVMWCDYCGKDNVGIDEPDEYEVSGVVYLEGECQECGQTIVSTIPEKVSQS